MNAYASIIVGILFTACVDTAGLSAQPAPLKVGIVKKQGQLVPGNIKLVTSQGDTVTTKELLTKPTVLSLVYYNCPGICTPLTNGLAGAIKKTDLTLGKDYQVLTVSFNPREGTDLARQKKKSFITMTGLDSSAHQGWIFCTSDSEDIAQLTQSVGFNYKPAGNDFLHPASVIFLGPGGKVTHYMNGTHFLPFQFKMSIIESSKGFSGPVSYKILRFFYYYDPSGDQYELNITRVVGTVIIGLALVLLLIGLIKKKKGRIRTKNKFELQK